MSVFMSKLISIVFHPIFMPIFSLWLVFNSNSIISHYYSGNMMGIPDQRYRIYLVFFITTVLMPAISFYILKRNRLVSSFSMPHRRERMFPYFSTLVYYVILYYLLRLNHFPSAFLSATLGTIVLMIVIILINTRMKISAHAAGIAGVTGMYAVMMKQGWIHGGVNMLAALILLSGIVSTARLSLNAHRDVEIYTGLLIGFVVEFVFMNYKLMI